MAKKKVETKKKVTRKKAVRQVDLVPFKGTIKEFLDIIKTGETNAVYLKKDRGTGLKKLWWADRDKWFCNWGECKTTNLFCEDVPWIIQPDLQKRIECANHLGYNMYIDKK